jgi:phosphoribosylformimino-5-aminoimidazole carboxamide ribotide isomerase
MTVFRPCIDLRRGRVVQIVGGTLSDDGVGERTNFVAEAPPGAFARRYRDDGLTGGHVIMLGPGNEEAARAALAAWPGGLQLGGGITLDNARTWLDAGASHLIVTSWLFPDGVFSGERLAALVAAVGRERLVIDLSCRRRDDGWRIAIDRWQRVTDSVLDAALLARLSGSCAEFLIHAADVEGLCRGIDGDLVTALGRWSPLPVVYAGGAAALDDLAQVEQRSQGRVDLTIGSALDLFGGNGVRYADCVAWNRARIA